MLQAAACSRQAGLTHLEAAQVMQELGSKCPHSSELLPIAAAVLVLCGPQRDTAALWLVFLLFRPISLLLLFFFFDLGDDAAFLRTQTFLVYLIDPGFR